MSNRLLNDLSHPQASASPPAKPVAGQKLVARSILTLGNHGEEVGAESLE